MAAWNRLNIECVFKQQHGQSESKGQSAVQEEQSESKVMKVLRLQGFSTLNTNDGGGGALGLRVEGAKTVDGAQVYASDPEGHRVYVVFKLREEASSSSTASARSKPIQAQPRSCMPSTSSRWASM